MSLTLGEIKTFAREQVLQTDTTDLPNSLLAMFAREGVNRIISKSNEWPHLKAQWTLNTIAEQHDYTLASISTNVDRVTNVLDASMSGMSLTEMDHQTATGWWIGSNDLSNSYLQYYSVYGTSLYLWPKPNDVRSLTILGRRTVLGMSGDGDVPDLPEYMHDAVAFFTVASCYGQQEDRDIQEMWNGIFEQSVQAGLERTFKQSGHRPVIVNGETQLKGVRSYEGWLMSNARG